MEYCKNKKLEGVGLHAPGAYYKICEECKKNYKPIKKSKFHNSHYYDNKQQDFRNETILANNWRTIKL